MTMGVLQIGLLGVFLLIISTSLLPYSWGANAAWQTDSVSKEATKVVNNSLAPLFSATPQFFPGCRVIFTVTIFLDLSQIICFHHLIYSIR